MFDQVIVELIKMEHHSTCRESDWPKWYARSVQFKPPFTDRVFIAVGEFLIRVGSKLKQHARTSLGPEPAQSPTFLIML